MIIILSDLHFADTSSYGLGGRQYNHNLPASVYRSYFREIAEFIRDDRINQIDLVLAGDIFETTRSALWHRDDLKPYVHNEEVFGGSQIEGRVTDILTEILKDPRVSETLDIFRSVSSILDKPVNIHYIPGNHDRLLNASKKIRHVVQSFLGLPYNDSPFQNQYLHYVQGEAKVLVRHGQEYDKSNFGANLELWPVIPTFIDKSYYDMPSIGDVVTVEVASKMPLLFQSHYSASRIEKDPQLLSIYERLIDFDNVRPANALLNFLFSTPGLNKREVWEMIEPILIRMLDEIALNPQTNSSMIKYAGLSGFSSKTLRSVLRSRVWRRGMPFWLIKALIRPISKKTILTSQAKFVLKETCLQPGASQIECVVSGHTHYPIVELLQVEGIREKYYINSGTFRNVITATPSLNEFGRLRSKARVLIFDKGERNPEYTRKTGWSFDFYQKFAYGSSEDSED